MRHVRLQALEWWFLTGEEQLMEAGRRIPPPPPQYSKHDTGIDLPGDLELCPLCHLHRVAPSLISTSGYVFCYKCAFQHVNQHGCCPVTRICASLDDIHRLFLAN